MEHFSNYQSCAHPTVGVEQEFHLIDPDSGELRAAHDAVAAELTDKISALTTEELKQCVIEGQSDVCETIDELYDSVLNVRRGVARAAREAGYRIAAAGCHPMSGWKQQPYVESGHYQWVAEETGYLTDRMMAFGLHVHVGMHSPETNLYAMHEFKRWVYPLLALSANSPYFDNCDTGLDSVRLHLFQSLPRTGLPPTVESMHDLEELYTKLTVTRDVTAPGDLWWMIRPQPPLGTVEVRAYDLPTDPARVAVLSAITQAAMAHFQDQCEKGEPRSEYIGEYLEENAWKAMRYGLDTEIVEPQTTEVLEMRSQIRRLLHLIGPKAQELGSGHYIRQAEDLLDEGNEATHQRRLVDAGDPDFRKLELEIARRTVAGR